MKAATTLIAAAMLAGCSLVKTPVPSVLTPPPAGLALNDSISDYDVVLYTEKILQLYGWRSLGLEVGDVAGAVTLDGLTAGAAAATAGKASPVVVSAIVAAGSFLAQSMGAVNPVARANALASGSGVLMVAEADYMADLAANGIKRISHQEITPWGAALYGKVARGITATNMLIVGILPIGYLSGIQAGPPSATPPPPKPLTQSEVGAIAARVNAERPATLPPASSIP